MTSMTGGKPPSNGPSFWQQQRWSQEESPASEQSTSASRRGDGKSKSQHAGADPLSSAEGHLSTANSLSDVFYYPEHVGLSLASLVPEGLDSAFGEGNSAIDAVANTAAAVKSARAARCAGPADYAPAVMEAHRGAERTALAVRRMFHKLRRPRADYLAQKSATNAELREDRLLREQLKAQGVMMPLAAHRRSEQRRLNQIREQCAVREKAVSREARELWRTESGYRKIEAEERQRHEQQIGKLRKKSAVFGSKAASSVTSVAGGLAHAGPVGIVGAVGGAAAKIALAVDAGLDHREILIQTAKARELRLSPFRVVRLLGMAEEEVWRSAAKLLGLESGSRGIAAAGAVAAAAGSMLLLAHPVTAVALVGVGCLTQGAASARSIYRQCTGRGLKSCPDAQRPLKCAPPPYDELLAIVTSNEEARRELAYYARLPPRVFEDLMRRRELGPLLRWIPTLAVA